MPRAPAAERPQPFAPPGHGHAALLHALRGVLALRDERIELLLGMCAQNCWPAILLSGAPVVVLGKLPK